MPLSDGMGAGCATADAADVCARHAAGCDGSGGCTGAAAAKLAGFLACYEGGFQEFNCKNSKTADTSCAATAGIDASAFSKCMGDAAFIKKAQAAINQAGANVRSFPKVTINGVDHSGDSQDPQSLKKALCGAGVQAAC